MQAWPKQVRPLRCRDVTTVHSVALRPHHIPWMIQGLKAGV